MKITESKLTGLIIECFNEVLSEGIEEMAMVQAQPTKQTMAFQHLCDQANAAVKMARQNESELIGSMGGYYPGSSFYEIDGDIQFTGNRNLRFTVSRGYGEGPEQINIKCFKVEGGQTVKNIDYMYEDYKSAVKYLKGIIKDAQKGISYNSQMDPNWSDQEQDKFNRKYGI